MFQQRVVTPKIKIEAQGDRVSSCIYHSGGYGRQGYRRIKTDAPGNCGSSWYRVVMLRISLSIYTCFID